MAHPPSLRRRRLVVLSAGVVSNTMEWWCVVELMWCVVRLVTGNPYPYPYKPVRFTWVWVRVGVELPMGYPRHALGPGLRLWGPKDQTEPDFQTLLSAHAIDVFQLFCQLFRHEWASNWYLIYASICRCRWPVIFLNFCPSAHAIDVFKFFCQLFRHK